MIKLVTVLFADVVGSTAQAELMHPEDTRALMAEFFDAMSEEIRAEGGTVERIIGDAIMADFGVPVAHEDDPIRAVRAALAMLERLGKFNVGRDEAAQIAIRIGINTGAVSTGGSFGEQLLVMGDAVNVAARLEQAAEPGTIVIGDRTARAVRDQFRLEELDTIHAKGKSEALTAFRVVGEFAFNEELSPSLVIPLVGREAEMKKLQDVFSSVRLGSTPQLVALLGDPGVGKSRLAREFLDWVQGQAKTLFGRCLPYGIGITFWPLREILRDEANLTSNDTSADVRDKLTAFAEAIVRRDSSAEGSSLLEACFTTMALGRGASRPSMPDPRETFAQLLQGWRSLLAHYSSERPLVVMIEDLHWADPTMLDVLDDFVRNLDGPVMFICASRTDLIDAHPEWLAGLRNLSSIHLDPLDDEAACRFMSLLLDLDELPEAFTQRVLDRAEGNPFFLEEILNRLIDEGYFALHEGRWEPVRNIANVDIPDNVQAVILARLDLLQPHERRALQLASVIGRTFWAGLLRELDGRDDLAGTLDILTRRNLVIERPTSSFQDDREFSFKHVLTRDVTYESLPRQPRGEAHAAVGGWLESSRGSRAVEIADIVAHHYDRAFQALADDDLRRKARAYYVVSSRNAAVSFAIPQAESLGQRAVELSEPGNDRVYALEAVADIYYLAGKGDAAWRTYLEALSELEDQEHPDRRSISRICANAVILPTRNWGSIDQPPPDEELEAVLDMGFEAVQQDSKRDRCLLLMARAFFDADRNRPAEARAAADEALELAEKLNDPDLVSAALDALAGTYMHPAGHYGDVERTTDQRLALVPRLGDLAEVADVYGMAAVTATLIGHYPDAVEHSSRSAETGMAVEAGAYLHALNWRTQARFMAGDWEGALRDEAELGRLEQRGPDDTPTSYSGRACAAVCFCLVLRGDEESERRLDLIRRFRDTSDWFINVSALPARALSRVGAAEEAMTWLDLSRWMYRAQHLEAACDILGCLEDWDQARYVLTQARDEVSSGGLFSLGFFADRLEAQLTEARGAPEDADGLFERSATGFDDAGAPWEAAWSRLLWAESIARRGDSHEATRLLGLALPVFRRLRSRNEVSRAAVLVGQV